MLNLTTKKNFLKSKKSNNGDLEFNRLKISDVERFYTNKNHNNFLYGLEYERLSLDKNTLRNASYSKIEKIIKDFCSILNWDVIYDDETVIAARDKNSSTTISLEPGNQMEISLEAKKDIIEIDLELTKIIKVLDEIALKYDVIFLGYGISPLSKPEEIEILNKKRYKIMDEFLPYQNNGELTRKMMRQSAGIQINVDYNSEKDAYYKLKFFNLIMPFITALCANSPLEDNKLSKRKSIRANVWRFCGKNRCNLFYKNIFDRFMASKNVFKNYIEQILDVPMIYIQRKERNYPLKGKMTFREFMKRGFSNRFALFDDYILHQSLCFPDVRLKQYIEIRNHDSSNYKMALALIAFYKGLCQSDIKKNLDNFYYLKIENVDSYNKNLIDGSLSDKIYKNITGWDILKKLFEISSKNLNSKEKTYLEPISKIIKTKTTQADKIINKKIKDAFELVEFIY